MELKQYLRLLFLVLISSCSFFNKKENAREISSESLNLCIERENTTLLLSQNGLNLDELILELKSKNPKLIVYGDSHSEFEKSYFAEVLKQFKQANFQIDCLLYEQPKSYGNRPPETRGMIINEAIEQGVRIYYIDDYQDALGEESSSLDGFNTRDHNMFENIEKIFEKNECRNAITYNGRSHLSSNSDERVTLTQRIKKKYPNTLVIGQIQMYEKDDDDQNIVSPNFSGFSCPNITYPVNTRDNDHLVLTPKRALDKPFSDFILTDEIIETWPESSYQNHLWNDFDYIILSNNKE